MNLVVLVLVSALMGAGGVVVKDEVQESRAQQVLMARVDAELRLASLELDFLARQLQEMERQFRAGLVGEDPLLSARAEVYQAEGRVSRLQLDLEEIQLTGKGPEDQVSAPQINGRDFVSERLALEEYAALERVRLAQLRLGRVQDLERVGAVPIAEVTQGVLALQEAESRLSRIHQRLGLRQRFLEGGVSGEEAERELEVTDTEAEVELLQMAVQDAGVRYQEASDRAALGVISDSELGQARLHLMRLETQLEFLEIKLLALRGGELSP